MSCLSFVHLVFKRFGQVTGCYLSPKRNAFFLAFVAFSSSARWLQARGLSLKLSFFGRFSCVCNLCASCQCQLVCITFDFGCCV